MGYPATFGWKSSAAASVLGATENDDTCGPWSFLDNAGRAELNGWRISVWPGGRFEVGIDLLCAEAGARLTWDGGSLDFVDPGSYGLTAQLAGFQPFRARFDSRSSGVIALTPAGGAAPAATILTTEDGFIPPRITVRKGQSVAWENDGWRNVDLGRVPPSVF